MPSMKRIAALMLAALMLAGAAVFAGCRGGKDEPSAAQPASQEDEEKARVTAITTAKRASSFPKGSVCSRADTAPTLPKARSPATAR